ncbi:MAG: 30S ribosome-binding factor RbfA [Candidatus Nanopelagicales bacterium]
MSNDGRARRLGDRIKVIVAEMLERRVKDPRLGFVTVTDARVTADLRDATVFYTVLGDEDAQRDTAAALESAKGVIRSEVGRQTGVRFTPTLTFVPDAVPENARHIEELLAAAARSDAEVTERAVGASYAGGENPYRTADETDEADETDDTGEAQSADTAETGPLG